MRVALVIAAKERGKTTLTKKLAHGIIKQAGAKGVHLRLLVYDTTGQWGVPYERWEAFTERMIDARNAVVVIEEATARLNSRHYSSAVEDAFIAARHHRCAFFLMFHSLRSVPEYLLNLTDDIYFMRTNDNPGTVARNYTKWPAIYDAWSRAQTAPKYTPVHVAIDG